MSTIDTAPLDNWPDSLSVRVEGDSLGTDTAAFKSKADDFVTAWNKLSGPGVYETPEAARLIAAATTVPDAATHVEDAGTNIRLFLGKFADVLDDLVPQRTTLLADITAFEARVEPPEPGPAAKPDEVSAHTSYQQDKRDLEARVKALGKEFSTAVTDCAGWIDHLDRTGRPDESWLRRLRESTGYKYSKGPLMSAAGIVVKTWEKAQSRTFTQRVWRAFGVDWRIPLTKGDQTFTSQRTWAWKKADFKLAGSWSEYFSTFGKKMRDRFWIEPRNGKWSAPEMKSSGIASEKWFGSSRETFEQTRNLKPAWARYGGRALGAAGTVMGMYGEEEKRYQELLSTHPELSDGEARRQAVEAGIVRGGSQALASAAATAAICSVVPGVGTAAGFVVGLGVGLAMSDVKIGGKSLGDHVGDLGENAWKGAKDTAKKTWNTVKGWFH